MNGFIAWHIHHFDFKRFINSLLGREVEEGYSIFSICLFLTRVVKCIATWERPRP